MEWKDLKTKLRQLLPQITDLNLFIDFPGDYSNILRLNDFRNNLVHLKSLREENFTYYQSLYKELTDFDFERYSQSVIEFIRKLD